MGGLFIAWEVFAGQAGVVEEGGMRRNVMPVFQSHVIL